MVQQCGSCKALSTFDECPFCGGTTVRLRTAHPVVEPSAEDAVQRPLVATKVAAQQTSSTPPTFATPPPPTAPSAPQTPSAPPTGPPPRGPSTVNVLLGAVVVALLVILVFLVLTLSENRAEGVTGRDAAAAATNPTSVAGTDLPSASVSESQPTPTTEPPLSPEQERAEALQILDEMVASDRALEPVRGQWVAQLASKYEGVVDLTQQAEPFTVPDILEEIMAARRHPEYGHLVRVILQGDWAKSEPGPTTMWVTVADLDASSRDEVVGWCESHFAQRGEALLNVCYPRELHRR